MATQANALAGLYLSRSIIKTLLAEGVIDRNQAGRIWAGAISECRSDGPTLTEYKAAVALMEKAQLADTRKP
jgi:hypothetical protein